MDRLAELEVTANCTAIWIPGAKAVKLACLEKTKHQVNMALNKRFSTGPPPLSAGGPRAEGTQKPAAGKLC